MKAGVHVGSWFTSKGVGPWCLAACEHRILDRWYWGRVSRKT